MDTSNTYHMRNPATPLPEENSNLSLDIHSNIEVPRGLTVSVFPNIQTPG